MFDECLASGHTSEMAHSASPGRSGLTVIIQSAILGTILLIPLIRTQTLPHAMMNTFLVAPPPPAPPPPPQQAVVEQVQPKTFAVNRMVDDLPDRSQSRWRSRRTKRRRLSRWSLLTRREYRRNGRRAGRNRPPEQRHRRHRQRTPNRIGVGGDVQSRAAVEADHAGISGHSQVGPRFGTVTLRAIISKDGSIERLE